MIQQNAKEVISVKEENIIVSSVTWKRTIYNLLHA